MFGIGGFELFIILIFGFLIFGPDKLPDIAKTVGKGIARFREAQQEVNEAIGDEKLIDFDNPDQPIKDPMEALDRIAQRHEEKKAAAKEAEASSAAAGDGGEEAGEPEPKQETFTERKARYERERAARKAAEAEAAKKAEEAPVEEAAAETAAEAPVADAPVETSADETPAEAPVEEAPAEPAADDDPAAAAASADAPAEGGDA